MKLIWKIRKHFAERRLRKLLSKHPKKRNHSIELGLEQEILRDDLAVEWQRELKKK